MCILADQSPFASVRIPDTKFYIYDVDMDNFLEMKVNKNRVPIECFWDQTDPRLFAIETEFVKDASLEGEGAEKEKTNLNNATVQEEGKEEENKPTSDEEW